MKCVAKCVVPILLFVLFFTIASPADAAFCQQKGDRQICILQIKRSAKNYWEYRVKVSIDGKVKPIEIYNCRDRLRVDKHGQVIPFSSEGSGEYICSFFK
ncbi:hypothetical protein [Spirulina sp. 06S082]|uniref:hypothetical protein n=1 Tax=Spirulina sp. 06S082 TaxID=3110248 RepID=UPI002B21DF6E|nr:hypothetical protein [Spirulina sp. 06S082]MEA5468562.1 hypothetical protein [Spirulina sp. 06S082]